jgi:hypothetical protein
LKIKNSNADHQVREPAALISPKDYYINENTSSADPQAVLHRRMRAHHPNGRPEHSPHPFCAMQIGNFLSCRACWKLCQTAPELHEAAATI